MLNRNDTYALLKEHKAADTQESKDLERAISLVGEQKYFWQADNGRSHITASCWILNPSMDSILLLHHRKLDRWLQPGGHIETADMDWLGAALREAQEETGIKSFKLLQEGIFDFDIHTIPARGKIPEHGHYDARFLLQAQQPELTVSSESNDLRWCSPDQAANLVGGDPVMDRMLLKTQHLFRASRYASAK